MLCFSFLPFVLLRQERVRRSQWNHYFHGLIRPFFSSSISFSFFSVNESKLCKIFRLESRETKKPRNTFYRVAASTLFSISLPPFFCSRSLEELFFDLDVPCNLSTPDVTPPAPS